MAQADDIELLRELYRMLNDEQAVKVDAVTDDFLLEQNPQMPGTRGTFRGPDGAKESFRELLSGFDALRFEPKEFEPYRGWLIGAADPRREIEKLVT